MTFLEGSLIKEQKISPPGRRRMCSLQGSVFGGQQPRAVRRRRPTSRRGARDRKPPTGRGRGRHTSASAHRQPRRPSRASGLLAASCFCPPRSGRDRTGRPAPTCRRSGRGRSGRTPGGCRSLPPPSRPASAGENSNRRRVPCQAA